LQYQEAGSYKSSIDIKSAGKQSAYFTTPKDAINTRTKGPSIHVVVEVADIGTPALIRYQRVIVDIE